MSRYENLVANFLLAYEKPELDELTVGFSGIDPPKKSSGGGTDDHEALTNLLGGDDNGHYHLTKDMWLQIIDFLENKDFDGGFAGTTDEEYDVNNDDWLNGGFAGTTDAEYNASQDSWADGGGAQW